MTIGLIVMTLAVFFVKSKFGIFNLMQAFFTLFNIPVIVPLAFGLIFRRVPKWSAVGGITWGLIVGATARYVLGWDIGPQVYLAFAMTFGIFSTSHLTARLYREKKVVLASIAAFISIAVAVLFYLTPVGQIEDWQKVLAFVGAVALGASLYGFAKLFAIEKEEEKKVLETFFKKLDTPIDVAKEVYVGGRKQVSTMPLVGRTVIFLGILVSMSYFTKLEGLEIYAVTAMVAILLGFGGALWIMGKRTEWKEEQERIRLTQATQ
jgi:hypothetical protein